MYLLQIRSITIFDPRQQIHNSPFWRTQSQNGEKTDPKQHPVHWRVTWRHAHSSGREWQVSHHPHEQTRGTHQVSTQQTSRLHHHQPIEQKHCILKYRRTQDIVQPRGRGWRKPTRPTENDQKDHGHELVTWWPIPSLRHDWWRDYHPWHNGLWA